MLESMKVARAQVDGQRAGRQPRRCLQGRSELLCARDVVLTDELDATARGHRARALARV